MKRGLHQLAPAKGSVASKKRVGRGLGSKGTYSGRGVKGQSARSGVSGLHLQGMRHLILSTPKLRGFKSPATKPSSVTLTMIQEAFPQGGLVTPILLKKKGVVSGHVTQVKILASGDCTKVFTMKHCEVSAGARTKIEAAGGTIIG